MITPEEKDALAHAAGYDDWDAWVVALEAEAGHPICGAKKRNGLPCQALPVDPDAPRKHDRRPRCKFHGGRSLVGLAAPAFRHGAYSRVLPANLRALAAEVVDDAAVASLRDDLALTATRVAELLARLDELGDAAHVDALGEAVALANEARAAGDDDLMDRALSRATDELALLRGASQVWREVYDVLNVRRRLAETERRREEFHANRVTVQQWQTLLAAIQEAIRAALPPGETVDATRALRMINERFLQLTSRVRQELPAPRYTEDPA